VRLILLLVVAAAAVPARGADTIVVKAKRIITVSGPEVENGAILIVDGRIRKVGKDVETPQGATVVEAAVVMPGLVHGASAYGLRGRGNEEAREITPETRVLDDIYAKSGDFKRAVQAGVTSCLVGPGDRNVIGGLGSVLKTSGSSLTDMVVREDVCLKAVMGAAPSRGNYPPRGMPPANFYARRPTTRMGVVWEFRKAFFDAQKHREDGGAKKSPAMDVLLRAVDKKLPLRMQASRSTDIETAVRLAEEFGLKFALEEGDEAWRCAELLAKADIPVFYRPSFQTRWIYGAEGSEVRFSAFSALLKAGVRTALLPVGEGESEGLLATAAFAVKYGAARDQALRAVTLTPAEILGVAERVGSLDAGKDADLLFLSGDPLDVTTRIERVLIGGKVAFGKNLSEY
jgi:imidazolonepropionase-like amidohydrolase